MYHVWCYTWCIESAYWWWEASYRSAEHTWVLKRRAWMNELYRVSIKGFDTPLPKFCVRLGGCIEKLPIVTFPGTKKYSDRLSPTWPIYIYNIYIYTYISGGNIYIYLHIYVYIYIYISIFWNKLMLVSHRNVTRSMHLQRYFASDSDSSLSKNLCKRAIIKKYPV